MGNELYQNGASRASSYLLAHQKTIVKRKMSLTLWSKRSKGDVHMARAGRSSSLRPKLPPSSCSRVVLNTLATLLDISRW